jgi:hypothetical protein
MILSTMLSHHRRTIQKLRPSFAGAEGSLDADENAAVWKQGCLNLLFGY